MGSHLYWFVSFSRSDDPRVWGSGSWNHVFDGRATGWDKFMVADAFGDTDPENPISSASGYLSREQIEENEKRSDECPWCEPYWVRLIDGIEFCDIIREKRWQTLKDDPGCECSPELRATAAMVKHLVDEGYSVRVTCWHSQ